MSDLSDLELCKRIAEIEDKLFPFGFWICSDWTWGYNPLTDDELCFQLMVKYDLDVMSPYRKNGETKWEAQAFLNNYANVISVYDEKPNRAICLAIIEAHNE